MEESIMLLIAAIAGVAASALAGPGIGIIVFFLVFLLG